MVRDQGYHRGNKRAWAQQELISGSQAAGNVRERVRAQQELLSGSQAVGNVGNIECVRPMGEAGL